MLLGHIIGGVELFFSGVAGINPRKVNQSPIGERAGIRLLRVWRIRLLYLMRGIQVRPDILQMLGKRLMQGFKRIENALWIGG